MTDLEIPAIHVQRLVHFGGQVYIAEKFLDVYEHDPYVGMIVRVSSWNGDDRFYEVAGPARRPDGGQISGEYGGWWLVRIEIEDHFEDVDVISDVDRYPPRPELEPRGRVDDPDGET